jgi:hypothetical protein
MMKAIKILFEGNANRNKIEKDWYLHVELIGDDPVRSLTHSTGGRWE